MTKTIVTNSGVHERVVDFKGTLNGYNCSCDHLFHYQGVDGLLVNQAPDWLGQGWPVPPHSVTNGGTYDGNCNCP